MISIATVSAQEYISLQTASSKLIKQYEAVDELVRAKSFDKALDRLNKTLKSEPKFIDALILKSEVCYAQEQFSCAIESLNASIALDSLYNKRNLYSLARLYEFDEKYGRAADCIRAYLIHGDLNSEREAEMHARLTSVSYKEKLVNSPVDFNPIFLPGHVNSDADEALPAVTIDGNRMVFTRREHGVEDLYTSKWDTENGEWGNGLPLSALNSVLNEGSHTISADGSVLAFTSCNRRGGFGSCDLYIAHRDSDGKWSTANNPPELNTAGWDGQPALTADGRGIYFSSNRKGGQGKRDIWYSEFQSNGNWTAPENCGSTLNSNGNESTPFLHYDDRTMYFMSDGHLGMGDYDIFRSSKSNEGWSEPTNLGYPINTSHREGGLSIHPDGHTAYFTKETQRGGTMDILQFELPLESRPQTISYLSGLVFDSETKLPVQAAIEIYALNDPSEKHNYSSRSDGTFTSAITHGKVYGLHVTAQDYAFYSQQFQFDSTEAYSSVLVRIPLQPIQETAQTVPEPIVLQNVEFETGSATLLSSSNAELEQLFSMLIENPDVNIQIQGHTDNVGSPEKNMLLSGERAQTVFQWLISKGLPNDQLSFVGFGETMPIASNDTEEGRQRNRRTEFMIVK